MERLPKFEVIGKVSPMEKEIVVDGQREIFLRQQDMLSPKEKAKFSLAEEKEKTPEQIAVLDFINIETNRLMVEAGVTPFNIPVKNYHIFPPEILKKLFDSEIGTYLHKGRLIGLSSELQKNLLTFAVVAFHEALHMKSRQIDEAFIDEKGEVQTEPYRGGVKSDSPHIRNKQGKRTSHFSGLDEAIVAWQEKISFPRLLDAPGLEAEKKRYFSEEAQKERQQISEKTKTPEDEIFRIENLEEGKWDGVGYRAQRRVLEYVCLEILAEFADVYQTKEDVFKVFVKATFNGNLIPIARLMKKTFGPHALRLLAMMKSKDNNMDANNLIEALGKMRRTRPTNSN